MSAARSRPCCVPDPFRSPRSALAATPSDRPANPARGTDPASIVAAFGEAENAHDLEGTLALFAGDAVLQNPSGTFTGHDEIREVYRGAFAGDVQAVARDVEVNGDRVTFISAATSDDFTRMGVAPFDLRIDATIRDGLIRRWVVTPTPEAAAKLEAAMASAALCTVGLPEPVTPTPRRLGKGQRSWHGMHALPHSWAVPGR